MIGQHNARGGSPFTCDGSSSTCGLGTALDTAPGTALGATQGEPLLRCRQRCKQRESSHNNQYKKSVARRTAPISTNSLAAFANSTAFAMGLPSTARGADMVETATSALLARAGQPGECQKKNTYAGRGTRPPAPPPPLSVRAREGTRVHTISACAHGPVVAASGIGDEPAQVSARSIWPYSPRTGRTGQTDRVIYSHQQRLYYLAGHTGLTAARSGRARTRERGTGDGREARGTEGRRGIGGKVYGTCGPARGADLVWMFAAAGHVAYFF